MSIERFFNKAAEAIGCLDMDKLIGALKKNINTPNLVKQAQEKLHIKFKSMSVAQELFVGEGRLSPLDCAEANFLSFLLKCNLDVAERAKKNPEDEYLRHGPHGVVSNQQAKDIIGQITLAIFHALLPLNYLLKSLQNGSPTTSPAITPVARSKSAASKLMGGLGGVKSFLGFRSSPGGSPEKATLKEKPLSPSDDLKIRAVIDIFHMLYLIKGESSLLGDEFHFTLKADDIMELLSALDAGKRGVIFEGKEAKREEPGYRGCIQYFSQETLANFRLKHILQKHQKRLDFVSAAPAPAPAPAPAGSDLDIFDKLPPALLLSNARSTSENSTGAASAGSSEMGSAYFGYFQLDSVSPTPRGSTVFLWGIGMGAGTDTPAKPLLSTTTGGSSSSGLTTCSAPGGYSSFDGLFS